MTNLAFSFSASPMVVLYYNTFTLFVYPTIAVQFGYRVGDELASEQQFMDLVNANASYYQLLVEAEMRVSN